MFGFAVGTSWEYLQGRAEVGADLRHVDSSHQEYLYTRSPDLGLESATFWGISTTLRWPGWEQGILFLGGMPWKPGSVAGKIPPSSTWSLTDLYFGACAEAEAPNKSFPSALLSTFSAYNYFSLTSSSRGTVFAKKKKAGICTRLCSSFLIFSAFFHCFIFRQAGWASGLCNSGSFLHFIFQIPLSFSRLLCISFPRILHGMAITHKKVDQALYSCLNICCSPRKTHFVFQSTHSYGFPIYWKTGSIQGPFMDSCCHWWFLNVNWDSSCLLSEGFFFHWGVEKMEKLEYFSWKGHAMII